MRFDAALMTVALVALFGRSGTAGDGVIRTRGLIIEDEAWRERCVVGDEKEHDRFQPMHVVSAGARETLPVLEELSGVVNPTWGPGPLTARRLLQAPQTFRPRSRIAPCAS